MNGTDGSDTYLVGPGDGFDNLNDTGTGAGDVDRILATADNTQIGATQLYGIEQISAAGFSGVNLIGSSGVHNTFDLRDVELVGIGEVSTQGGDDTIWTSNVSGGGQNYRGGAGHDTFHLGSQGTNLLVSSADNGGFDSFEGNVANDGTVHVLKAEDAGTDIGLGTTFINGVDIITADGHADVRIAGSDGAHNNWDFSQTQLTGIAEIASGGGNDTVIGSDGDDTIRGGTGNDVITGGAGNDKFVYNNTNEGSDTILDFGAGDEIDFSSAQFGNLAVGTLDSTHFIANETGATNNDQVFWFKASNQTLYYDAGGNSGDAAIAIAKLENGHALTSGEIHMV
jgi:Ca2+-binding RTX toxin-like protein